MSVAPGQTQLVMAWCPTGLHATGGGYFSSIAHAAGSIPRQLDDGWGVIITNDTSITVTANAYVVCV